MQSLAPGRTGQPRQAVVQELQRHRLGLCANGTRLGTLKVGRLYGTRFAAQRQAVDEVCERLRFYNDRRRQPAPGYVSLMTFTANWHAGEA